MENNNIKHNGKPIFSWAFESKSEKCTHEFDKGSAPISLIPGELIDTFQPDQESSLKVKEFIETGE